jgi:hypothetical protein
MPANARKDIVREGEIGTYHCWSRCVQRAFLCGYDPVSERDFDYRRGWIEDLLAYLARVFAIDVGNYSVLSNHLHALLRTRPDLAALWSAEEVALRWKLAWPEFLDGQWVREPTDAELDMLLAQPAKIEQIRRRLGSLSWFMARWKEPIARLCNAEMDTRGHFWDARFRSRELLDDEAVLTCSLYVDLNQSRAGMADSLEDSRHSAIRQRILAAKEREARASYDDVQARALDACRDFSLVQARSLFADCYLAPIAVEGPLLTTDALRQAQQRLGLASGDVPASAARLILPATVAAPPEQAESNERTDAAAPASAPSADDRQDAPPEVAAAPGPGAARLRPQSLPRRASDVPFLAMALSEYLRLARTLASRIVRERAESRATHAAGPDQLDETGLHAALARWGINPAVWLAQFQRLDCQCTRALGTAERVLRRAREVAQQRFHGISLCRAVFATTPADGFT